MTSPASGDCLFCSIVAGDVPADVVRRDERTVAFRDIVPQAPVHVLVVPVRHITDAGVLSDEDSEDLAAVFAAARAVADDEGIASTGFRLVFNVGKDAQNSVPHLHLHVLGGRDLTGRLG
jgi:histidine triad (HIT) family protein